MKSTDFVDNESLRTDVPDLRGWRRGQGARQGRRGQSRAACRSSRATSSAQGCGIRETYTVRKVSYGVGVERTFPVHTPIVAKLEVVKRGDVRRAKLYYLRDRVGKAAKIREKRDELR